MICHGQGDTGADPFAGGCCYVDGAVCPVRWYIDYSTSTPAGDVGTATILDANRVSLGTVSAYVSSLMPGGGPTKAARVQRVLDQVKGVRYVCSAAAYVIGMDPSLINDRPAFEAAWGARAEYQPIADFWQSIGLPRNYCQVYGPNQVQCCFAEDPTTNAAKSAALSVTAVTVRRAASGASQA